MAASCSNLGVPFLSACREEKPRVPGNAHGEFGSRKRLHAGCARMFLFAISVVILLVALDVKDLLRGASRRLAR